MKRDTLKIERHYGNKNLETIMEDLVLKKLSNFKLSSNTNNIPYYNIGTNTRDIYETANKS